VDQIDVLGTVMFSWRGFAKPEDANSHIQVFEELFPLGQYYSYTFLKHPVLPGFVLQVEVRKSRQIAFASDGIPYLRRSAQNLPQDTPEKLARLRLDKGIASFESETTDAAIQTVSNRRAICSVVMVVCWRSLEASATMPGSPLARPLKSASFQRRLRSSSRGECDCLGRDASARSPGGDPLRRWTRRGRLGEASLPSSYW